MKATSLNQEDFERIHAELLALAQSKKLCPGQERAGEEKLLLSSYVRHGGHLGIVGKGGCALLVFTGCALRCRACLYDKWAIEKEGLEKTPEAIAKILLTAQAQGNQRIVFMNASHIVHLLLPAIAQAVEQGLSLPLVWYTHGYEYPETLALLAQVFDIFVVDFKFADPSYASWYTGAPDYTEKLFRATKWLDENVGPLVIENDYPKAGYVLRHLLLPDQLKQTEAVFRWIAKNLGYDTYVELIPAFVPVYRAQEAGLGRRTTEVDTNKALEMARRLGLSRVKVC